MPSSALGCCVLQNGRGIHQLRATGGRVPVDPVLKKRKEGAMGLKIKWKDDRVRGATTALLLISRDRLSRGETEDLIQASLAEYRDDLDGYKKNKATWADVSDLGPLTNPRHVARYKNLLTAVEGLLQKIVQGKRQFNSLAELDNFLIFALRNVS